VDTRTANRRVLEALIKCGAGDCFGETRATLWASLERTLARATRVAQDRARGQISMFGMLEEKAATRIEAGQQLPEWPQNELLASEKELLGFYVTGHPLTPYAPLLRKLSLATTRSLSQLPNRSLTRIGGLIAAVQNGYSKKSNKPYALVTLEDLEGSVQVLCMNENYEKYRDLLTVNMAILVVGEVNTGDDKPKIFPQEIMALEDAPRRFTRQVHLRLHAAHLSEAALKRVFDLISANPGKCPLFLSLELTTGEKVFIEAHERFAVTPSLALQKAVEAAFGEGSYYAKVDTSVPERAPRHWERRGESAEGEA
jgi:DNA polymerase-3 subunit alpha